MDMRSVWVEIPVKDIERALRFYSAVFELSAEITDDGVRRTTTIFHGSDNSGGVSLNKTANFDPGANGPLIYFEAGDDLSTTLARVAPAGGTVIIPKTPMGEGMGFYATFHDSEGNTLALYSMR